MLRLALGLALLTTSCGSPPPSEPGPPPTAPTASTSSTASTSPTASPPPTAAEPFSDAWLLAQAPRYLGDPAARRSALERSLTNPKNLYSRTRLAAYGRGDFGWDLLPEWNPRVQPVTAATGPALAAGALTLDRDIQPLWDRQRPTTMAGWVELGRRVFLYYPLRPEVFTEHALAHPALAKQIGLHSAADGEVPGAVAFVDIDGEHRVGITCALCHSTREGDAVVLGRARRDLDYGAMRVAYHRDTGAPIDAELARRMASWGPGRADITEDDDEDPVAIPDLWGLRRLGTLTQAATLRHAELGPDAPLVLAIRQETQILHANRERSRPPRELTWALAMFLYSLEPPPRPTAVASAEKGRDIFRRDCETCHADPAGSGPPIAAEDIGTDPALALGTSRGTGLYRPAPLLRVAEAGPYLHHGVIATLEDMFDPARLRPDYTGSPRGPGKVAGHTPGTDLPPDERAALIAYLHTL